MMQKKSLMDDAAKTLAYYSQISENYRENLESIQKRKKGILHTG